ncbi:MAG: ATP-binding protein, partial [Bdellovibrionota bacterium]
MNTAVCLAITGGPSGGKTTLLDTLKKELGSQVSLVPEAASILYRGGYPRLKSLEARKHTQRAIYYVQRELELLIEIEKKAPLLLCDRGSLDGIAYWPLSETDFMNELQTTREKELA